MNPFAHFFAPLDEAIEHNRKTPPVDPAVAKLNALLDEYAANPIPADFEEDLLGEDVP